MPPSGQQLFPCAGNSARKVIAHLGKILQFHFIETCLPVLRHIVAPADPPLTMNASLHAGKFNGKFHCEGAPFHLQCCQLWQREFSKIIIIIIAAARCHTLQHTDGETTFHRVEANAVKVRLEKFGLYFSICAADLCVLLIVSAASRQWHNGCKTRSEGNTAELEGSP